MATLSPPQNTTVSAVARKEVMRSLIQVAGMLPVLIVICVLFAFLTESFLTTNNLINVVRQASINIVLAAGMTFVILTGGIDLAVGSVLGMTAVLSLLVSLNPSLSWAAIPIALLSGTIVGVITGCIVHYFGLPPFIVTLGTYTALRGAAYLFAGGTTLINNDLSFAWIGNSYLGPIPWLVVIALVVILASAFILHRTVLGVHIYAVGGNPLAARLTGIPVATVLIFVYGISGFLSGLGGVMQASRLYRRKGVWERATNWMRLPPSYLAAPASPVHRYRLWNAHRRSHCCCPQQRPDPDECVILLATGRQGCRDHPGRAAR